MPKKKRKLVKRRPFTSSDFRKSPRRLVDVDIVFCEGHGYIDVAGLKKTFPDKNERLKYLQALYKGLGT